MTKRNLLLVSLLLVFGLSASATGLPAATGISFDASPTFNEIRTEGQSEATGTLSIYYLGGASSIASGSTFVITYNEPIAELGTTTTYAVTVGGICGPTGQNVYSITSITHTVYPGSLYPTYTGTLGPGTLNTVTLTFSSPCTGLTTSSNALISIAVRVVANVLPVSWPIAATINPAVGGNSFSTITGQSSTYGFEVAETAPGPALSISFKEGPEQVLTCIGIKDDSGTPYDNDFSLYIVENWIDALTSHSDEYVLEADGYSTTGSGPTIVATNGSEILITLSGIPSGVGVAARWPYPCEDFSTKDPNYCAGGNLYFSDLAASGITGGMESFFYRIHSTNVSVVEGAYFGFKLWSHGPLPPNALTPQGYQIWATVSLTDNHQPSGDFGFSTLETATTDMPYFVTNEGAPFSVVEFSDCVTSLLFPYINAYWSGTGTAFANFGTGIDFANTTLDPFALPGTTNGTSYLYPNMESGSAVPQYGSCTFYFYPSTTTGTVKVASPDTTQTVTVTPGTPEVFITPVIPAGGSFAFDVASSVPGGAGKTGYAIAICNFQNAYGYAEIYDNYTLGSPTATLAYLAYVLPDPSFYPRSPAGDALGEEAGAPLNFNKKMLKFFMLNESGLCTRGRE